MLMRLEVTDGQGRLQSISLEFESGELSAAKELIAFARRPAVADRARVPAPAGERIRTLVERYCASACWQGRSRDDIRGDLMQIAWLRGDVPPADLTRRQFGDAQDVLRRLPANMNKLRATKGRSVEEILALGLPPQSATTVKKKWERLIAFLDWAEGRGYVERNLACGVRMRARHGSYEKFTDDDLRRLFETEEYTVGFGEAFKYWVPLIGLFSGARLEEICQLHVADVAPIDGVLCFRITVEVDPEQGDASHEKRLKTADSSARVCPVHPTLIALGLEVFVDDLRKRGYKRLFPELRVDAAGKVGGRATEWFTAYRRSRSVGDALGRSRKAFHSFRHTVNYRLQLAGVPLEVREQLVGHKSRAINAAVYGGPLGPQTLLDALERLTYSLNLPQYTPRVAHERARRKAQRQRNFDWKQTPSRSLRPSAPQRRQPLGQ